MFVWNRSDFFQWKCPALCWSPVLVFGRRMTALTFDHGTRVCDGRRLAAAWRHLAPFHRFEELALADDASVNQSVLSAVVDGPKWCIAAVHYCHHVLQTSRMLGRSSDISRCCFFHSFSFQFHSWSLCVTYGRSTHCRCI